MIKLYGIPNCDSVKKAMDWLKQHNLPFEFYNYKKDGITAAKLQEWCIHFGWENVLNKNGTTWKGLPEKKQAAIRSEKTAILFLVEHTSAIRRPVTEANGKYLIRFKEEEFSKTFLESNV